MGFSKYINTGASKIALILLVPILDITYAVLTLFFNITFLGQWALRVLAIPVMHFCITTAVLKLCKYNRKNKLLLLVSSVAIIGSTIIGECLRLLVYSKYSIDFLFVFRLVWTVICGLVIVSLYEILKMKNNKLYKICFSIEAFVLLSVNAFTTYLLSPKLEKIMYGVELILLPATIILLCVFSYCYGRVLPKRKVVIKLFIWLVGITTSCFIALYLLGTPHTPPISSVRGMIVWVRMILFVFCFCILGVILSRRADRKKETK